jgi:hypothetical protein
MSAGFIGAGRCGLFLQGGKLRKHGGYVELNDLICCGVNSDATISVVSIFLHASTDAFISLDSLATPRLLQTPAYQIRN